MSLSLALAGGQIGRYGLAHTVSSLVPRQHYHHFAAPVAAIGAAAAVARGQRRVPTATRIAIEQSGVQCYHGPLPVSASGWPLKPHGSSPHAHPHTVWCHLVLTQRYGSTDAATKPPPVGDDKDDKKPARKESKIEGPAETLIERTVRRLRAQRKEAEANMNFVRLLDDDKKPTPKVRCRATRHGVVVWRLLQLRPRRTPAASHSNPPPPIHQVARWM